MPNFQITSQNRPANILVVEDNKLNQQVVREILLKMGARVQVANNGIEALNFLNNTDVVVDLVLMDIQMPEMDGLTATQHIRKIDKYKTLPIVALTANASMRDREQCLMMGMDEHVAKPVDFNQLFSVLEHYLAQQDIALGQQMNAEVVPQCVEQDEMQEIPMSSETVVLLDIEGLLNRINHNQSLVEILMRSFIQENVTTMADIEQALSQQQIAVAQRLVHTLKGVAGNLSLQTLHRVSEQVDAALKNQDMTQVTALFPAMQQCFQDTAQAIEHFLLQSQSPSTAAEQTEAAGLAEVDNDALRLQIQELYQLLNKNNMRSKRLFEDMKPMLLDVSCADEDVHSIDDALRKLAFKQAVPKLKLLAEKLNIELVG